MHSKTRILLRTTALVIFGAAAGALAADPALTPWAKMKPLYLQGTRNEHDALATWREAAAWNFDQGGMPPEFKVREGGWEVKDGKLIASAGGRDQNRVLQIAQCQWPAFRLEFDAQLTANAGEDPDKICDIGIRFNSDPATASLDSGYGVLTATYGNQATTFYRLNIPAARTEWSPIVPGKTHHVALEVVKPHFRLWVDDRVVLDYWERHGRGAADSSDFLAMDPQRVMALQTYDTQMTIDNLKISVPQTR